jgi:ABC-type transport system substrate-binding protein
MTRKLTAWILALALMMGCVGGVAEEAEKTSVTVGSLSLLTGDFFTELWGNNTSDIDVRALIHGYSTVAWTYDGEYAVDATVVRDTQVTLDADGNKTYTFTLSDELQYNNGDAISAYDYAFTVLLLSSPLLTEMGVKNDMYAHLTGSGAYRDGTSNVFSGVRVTDDHTLSLTIKAENLPYYYELMLAEVTPYPISVLMPGCSVKEKATARISTTAKSRADSPPRCFPRRSLTRIRDILRIPPSARVRISFRPTTTRRMPRSLI